MPPPNPQRRILHVDMDCFFAAVEMREDPSLRDIPIAVGGCSARGVVCTCNYPAREYGVRSAMPAFKARELCPQLRFLPVRFELYLRASRRIRAIFERLTPLVEPLSLDEAYLDVTDNHGRAWDLAKWLRAEIARETRLTASVGVAENKMLAKIATSVRKPDGQFAILPGEAEAFLAPLPVRKIPGIGPKSTRRLAEMGVETIGDLRRFSRDQLAAAFGRWGHELYDRSRGRDDRPVEPSRARKSLSNERTYEQDLPTLEACQGALVPLVDELHDDLRKKPLPGLVRSLFVKVKFADFRVTTREGPLPPTAYPDLNPFQDNLAEGEGAPIPQLTLDDFLPLLDEGWQRRAAPVRLLGAGVRFASPHEDTTAHPAQLSLPFAEVF